MGGVFFLPVAILVEGYTLLYCLVNECNSRELRGNGVWSDDPTSNDMMLQEWSFRLRFGLDFTPRQEQTGFRLVLQKDCSAEDTAATLQPVTDVSTRRIRAESYLVQSQGYAAVVYVGSLQSTADPEILLVQGLDGQEWGRYESDGSPLGPGIFKGLPSRSGNRIAVYTYRPNRDTVRVQILEVSSTGLQEMYDAPIEFTLSVFPYVAWSMDDASLIFTDQMTNQVELNVAEGTINISDGDVSCLTLYPPSVSDGYRIGASCVVNGEDRAASAPLC